jgi:DNA polymerase III subunit delta'
MTMPDILLHPSTAAQLQIFADRPTQSVVVIGPEGIGKGAVVRELLTRLLRANDDALDSYPYMQIITPEKQSISIEAIRDAQSFTKLKIPGGQLRIVVVESAETLTAEAQNALLKLLEEPPEGTFILLSTANHYALLPTIRSRVQAITVQEPSREAVEAYFANQGFDAKRVQQSFLMSGGLPGLMHSLLTQDTEHPLAATVEQARNVLRSSTFERLTMIESLSKQKPEALRLLFVLQQMARAAIAQSATKDSAGAGSIRQWQHILKSSYDAEKQLLDSGQPKLVLTNLLLGL